jgi:hypothetical protein
LRGLRENDGKSRNQLGGDLMPAIATAGPARAFLKQFERRAMKPGEKVEFFVRGWVGDMFGKGATRQKNGVLVLTDQRVVFYHKLLWAELTLAIPLVRVTSFDRQRGIHGQLVVHSQDGSVIHFKTMAMKDLDAFTAALESSAARSPTLVDHAAPAPSSTIANLERLVALKEKGALTQDEFDAAKARLLA